MTDDDLARFWGHIRKDGDCWLSTYAPNNHGYCSIAIGGKSVLMHRLAYEHFIGRIPDGLELDHICRHRACCNPAHLEPVDHRANIARGELGVLMTAETRARLRRQAKTANPHPEISAEQRDKMTAGATAHQRSKKTCPAGHPYEGANLYISRRGHRYCRACRAAASRAWWHRTHQKEAA